MRSLLLVAALLLSSSCGPKALTPDEVKIELGKAGVSVWYVGSGADGLGVKVDCPSRMQTEVTVDPKAWREAQAQGNFLSYLSSLRHVVDVQCYEIDKKLRGGK